MSRRELMKAGAVWLTGMSLPGPRTALTQLAQKRIYIAPDDHTDYFWTAGPDTYRQSFLKMLDYYLDLADKTAHEPPEHQSRWNCDGYYWMWTYEQNRTPSQFQQLIDRIQDGHISVPLNALCVCLGGAPAEAVIRGMYYPGSIERRFDLRFTLAYGIENQTLPYGIVSLWSGAGALYSWKGICGCDTPTVFQNRDHEIYWWVGPDGKRMLMKWNSMMAGNQGIGGYAEARDPAAVVEYVDNNANFISRYPYRVIGAFGKGWDDLETLTDSFVTVAKSKSDATRQVIVSNEEDFFADFNNTYKDNIPSVSASFGNEWDLYCAAMAETSAIVKRAVEKLRTAEALATLVALQEPDFMDGREAARNQAWVNLGLFWEHNFGMVGRPSGLKQERVSWQKQLAAQIAAYTDTLYEDAIDALGGMIQSGESNSRFFIFNPLNWDRTDLADLPLSGSAEVHVVDMLTGQAVPSQRISLNGVANLRILATVPGVSYRVYEVRVGPGDGAFPDAATINGNVVENDFYQIKVAQNGAITSLIDKMQGNREFAETVDGRTMNDLVPGSGTLAPENVGPVSVTLRVNSSGSLTHTTRVTLFRDINRIDLHNTIDQNFDKVFTWAFGFNLNNPDVWHEEVGAIIRAKLLSNGGHYSPTTARYDWLTLNHFADMSGSGVGVTLSNADCYFMKLGNSSLSDLDTATPQISVLAGGRVVNGNPAGGIRSQGGDSQFTQRFALKTHGAYNAAAAMRFALEHQNPLVAGSVTGNGPYPETQLTLAAVPDKDTILWALKPADDGVDQGVIARLWNVSNDSASFALSMPGHPIRSAMRTTHIETPIETLDVQEGHLNITLNGQEIATFLVQNASFTGDGTM